MWLNNYAWSAPHAPPLSERKWAYHWMTETTTDTEPACDHGQFIYTIHCCQIRRSALSALWYAHFLYDGGAPCMWCTSCIIINHMHGYIGSYIGTMGKCRIMWCAKCDCCRLLDHVGHTQTETTTDTEPAWLHEITILNLDTEFKCTQCS